MTKTPFPQVFADRMKLKKKEPAVPAAAPPTREDRRKELMAKIAMGREERKAKLKADFEARKAEMMARIKARKPA